MPEKGSIVDYIEEDAGRAQATEYVYCYYCLYHIIDQRTYPDFERTNTETACGECKKRIRQ